MKFNFGLIEEFAVVGFGFNKLQAASEKRICTEHLLTYGSYSPCLYAAQLELERHNAKGAMTFVGVTALVASAILMAVSNYGVWFWTGAFYAVAASTLLWKLRTNSKNVDPLAVQSDA